MFTGIVIHIASYNYNYTYGYTVVILIGLYLHAQIGMHVFVNSW